MENKKEKPNKEILINFAKELENILGNNLACVILYGSEQEGTANADSDVDIAVIVSDIEANKSREVVRRFYQTGTYVKYSLSISVETYARLTEFVCLGDPYAVTVCKNGEAIYERNSSFQRLKQITDNVQTKIDGKKLFSYLINKANTRYSLAQSSLGELFASLQMTVMSYTQALSISQTESLTYEEIAKLSKWDYLRSQLIELGADRKDVELLDSIIETNKRFGSSQPFLFGRDVADAIQETEEIFRRLRKDIS